MTDLDIAIVNGQIVNATGVVAGSIGIRDGVIAAVAGAGVTLLADRVIDAAGRHILPGVVDPHVHFRLAGRTFGDLCERETRSLISGGVTTAIVFTEAPHQSYQPILEERTAEIDRQSYCDIGIHPMIQSIDHVREIPAMASRWGISSFKAYFAGSSRELYPETFAVDDGVLFAMFGAVATLGSPAMAMVHAENWEVAAVLQAELQAAGRVDAAAWSESKPAFVEDECIRRAAFYAAQQHCPLYIVHTSSAAGVRAIREARGRGQTISGETCPHYLMVHQDADQAILAKYNPAVKTAADNEALWQAIANGDLACMGSDHIPVRWEDKAKPGFDDVWTARGGVPGSATILPLLLSEGVNRGRLTLPQVAALTSTNPARLFGLGSRKGVIAPGRDADLVMVDLDRRLTFDPSLLQVDFSLFTGQDWTGWPTMTILAGQVVMDEGDILGHPGDGRYLRRMDRQ